VIPARYFPFRNKKSPARGFDILSDRVPILERAIVLIIFFGLLVIDKAHPGYKPNHDSDDDDKCVGATSYYLFEKHKTLILVA
jgi:hypothetical protein